MDRPPVESIDLIARAEELGYGAMSEKGKGFLRTVNEIAVQQGGGICSRQIVALAIALACEFEDH
jgi:hypothetical protein